MVAQLRASDDDPLVEMMIRPPESVKKAAVAAAGASGDSVSKWVTEAIRLRLAVDAAASEPSDECDNIPDYEY